MLLLRLISLLDGLLSRPKICELKQKMTKKELEAREVQLCPLKDLLNTNALQSLNLARTKFYFYKALPPILWEKTSPPFLSWPNFVQV